MSSIKSITAKKAQLYKAIHELECWSNDEDKQWRYIAIRDYNAAIMALRLVMVEASGECFANELCGAIDEMVKNRYHFDEADIAEAKLMYYSFLRRV